MLKDYIEYSKEVLEAKEAGKPIVALESTIISHGMPYPENYEVALHCQEVIRENGAVPATMAILDGKLKIGLEKHEIERLAKEGRSVLKVSRRDIPYAVMSKKSGALTVAATMILASVAGIKMFATGGIGGVHRGVSDTWDISADLEELAITNVNVVCAGAKAILDLPKTLEYLETKGVMVIGYQTDKLPSFYSRTSKYNVPLRLDSPEEIAEFISKKDELELRNGTLITNPIPEQYSLDNELMEKVINQAIEEMNEKGIVGKETTPFLLAKIVELTGGNSLEANIKLVYNNCKLASQIARCLNM